MFGLSQALLCCKTRKSEQMSWERKCNRTSRLPQGIAQPLQPWLEDLCPWEPCSPLSVFFYWHLKAHFLSAKAATSEDNLPHQDLYEADFLNSVLHGFTMKMLLFKYFFVLEETSVSCCLKAWGGMVCSACSVGGLLLMLGRSNFNA